MEDRIIILNSLEYMVLAGIAGASSLYGFDMSIDDIPEEEVIIALQKLNRRKYVESDGDSFILKEDIALIFDIIINGSTMMDVHKKSGRKCIVYIDEKAVKVTRSLRRKDCFELCIMPVSSVWQSLIDEGWIGDGV